MKGNERPEEAIKHSLTSPSDGDEFQRLRLQGNAEIEAWAERLHDADLDGMLVCIPGTAQRGSRGQRRTVLSNFQRQTHHRGHVHAMLTAAGAKPEPTDLSRLA
ncbi:putative damage-inducible protein DinB [Rhizobium tibeticum]|nr:putative damage-inducible protein DinB [Rhizobium tibeticum]